MSDTWKDIIGNDFDEKDMKEKTINIFKELEDVKKEIEEEEKKYRDKWNSLSKEKKEELILEVEKIATTKPFVRLAMTKKVILCELMERI